MIESASLEAWKCVKALRGTGVATVVDDVLLELPPAVVVPEPERVVPPWEVFVLDETPVEVEVLERTLLVLPVVLEVESAEPELTVVRAELVDWLLDESAELVVEAELTPLVVEAVKVELPELAAVPEPAPDEEPAVADGVVATLPVCEDWT